MLQKTQPVAYARELPEIDHRTISLRTQLRLHYEANAWLRYLSLGGLAAVGVLLAIVPGGFPLRVFGVLWQELPQGGHLLALHGWAAFFALAALLIQALTWLVLWGLYLLICRALVRYTWRLQRSQAFMASSWLPSTRQPQGEHAAPSSRVGGLPLYLVPASPRNSSPPLARVVPGPNMPQGRPPQPPPPPAMPSYARAQPQAPAGVPQRVDPAPSARPVAEASMSRQFAQPTMPFTRPRVGGDPSTSALRADWPSLALASGPGVAWDVGLTRKGRPNEDSVLTLRGTCNFAERLLPFELHIVADGMGGHAQGRLASHLAIRGMLETVIPGLVACNALESEQIVDVLIDGVHWANQVIYQHGQEHGADMGTTITAVLVLDEIAYIINVGDSRTYVYRPNAGLSQITRDHSLVARLVETGAISPDEIYTHPDRNKVYRGLGDKTDVTVDWFMLPVQVGDLLLLCSDGLWEMVRNPRITEILTTYSSAPALASHALLQAALQAGGKDNVSLLVVRVQP